jgi:hypothetical protein
MITEKEYEILNRFKKLQSDHLADPYEGSYLGDAIELLQEMIDLYILEDEEQSRTDDKKDEIQLK